MNIVVVSDTHGVQRNIKKVLPYIRKADMFIHAGDHFRDSVNISRETSVPCMGVVGNCDFDNSEPELFFEVEGLKIFLTHGHSYGVKYGLDGLVTKAQELGADIVIFGHTHTKLDETVNGIRIINPGSLSLPRDSHNGTFVLMCVENGSCAVSFREV